MYFLAEHGKPIDFVLKSKSTKNKSFQFNDAENHLQVVLNAAKIRMPAKIFFFLCLSLGLLLSIPCVKFMSTWCVFVFLPLGCWLPYSFVLSKAEKNSSDFLKDFPSVLLATASSLKAGITPLNALERAISLLPKESIVKNEIETMLAKIRGGTPKEKAISGFATNILNADIELFKSAFSLALDNGGKFSQTLEHIATVAQDRAMLIGSARVSTANMRMTANTLLGLVPIITGMLASRTENFFQIIIENPLANSTASLGLTIITAGYFFLRKMSNFKP